MNVIGKGVVERGVAGLGVPVVFERAPTSYPDGRRIVLPDDVPSDMQEATLGMVLHEVEHVIAADHVWGRKHLDIHMALNVVMDIRNDARVYRKQTEVMPGLYQAILEYFDEKDRVIGDKPLAGLICWELKLRSWPREAAEGWHTTDPRVRRWFKKHPKWKRLIGECRVVDDDTRGRATLVRWARWLLENLQSDDVDTDGTLILPGTHGLEAIDQADMKVKDPERRTVERLAEFLRDKLAEPLAWEEGRLNVRALPRHWSDPPDLLGTPRPRREKRVRLYLVVDASTSMLQPLKDGRRRFEGAFQATVLVCQAAEWVARDHGLEVECRVLAFHDRPVEIKRGDEPYSRDKLMTGYTSEILKGSCTDIVAAAKAVESTPPEPRTQDFVFVVTDGEIGPDQAEWLLRSLGGTKRWVLLGIGADLRETRLFKDVADTVHGAEVALTKAIEEVI